MSDEPQSAGPRGAAFLGLAAVAALVILVRALGFEEVLQQGQVVFPPMDAQYHLRRAFYSFVHFPDVLLYDVYINHPGGAPISWPPLFDLGLAAVARVVARDVRGFELVAAWAPPLLAASTVVPLWLAGRALGSRRLGLGAGCILAFLPIHFFYSALGNADHHAAVAVLGAWLLWLCMALVDPTASASRVARLGVGLALAELAMMLTWHGSLLYLALVNGLLLASAIATGSRRLPAAQAAAAAASAAGLVPVLAVSPEPLGGPVSAIALSWLHVAAMSSAAVVAGALALAGRAAGRGVGARLAWVALAAAALVGGLVAWPPTRAGLALAVGFLSMSDGAGPATSEQRSLFPGLGWASEPDPTSVWGAFAYLLPLAPLAPLLLARVAPRGGARRAAALVLAGWCAWFCPLAIAQLRYGNDAAPAASLAFAIGLAAAARWIVSRVPGASVRPARAAPVVAALVFAALAAPAVETVFLPRAHASLAALRGEAWPRERAAASVAAKAARFLTDVRAVTPETSGYLDDWRDAPSPEYGVVAHPNLGHAIQYVAHRATGTDPFWAYIGARSWAFTSAFLGARTEAQALRAVAELDGRYVVTMPTREQGTVPWRLHFFDGNAVDRHPALARFRLITESRGAGQSVLARRAPDPPDTPAYKLFEVVEGARLVVATEPGTDVVASLALSAPSGRAFEHAVRARADAEGFAVLRVPYPTSALSPVQAKGRYRVRSRAAGRAVAVSEEDVANGATVRVDLTSAR